MSPRTHDPNLCSIWSKVSIQEREALKLISDEREMTISQLVRLALKDKGWLS